MARLPVRGQPDLVAALGDLRAVGVGEFLEVVLVASRRENEKQSKQWFQDSPASVRNVSIVSPKPGDG